MQGEKGSSQSVSSTAAQSRERSAQERRSSSPGTVSTPLLERLCRARAGVVLSFAGQGFDVLGELSQLASERTSVRQWVRQATDRWVKMIGERPFVWSGLYDGGVDVAGWLSGTVVVPEAGYLTSSVIAQPLIFICQVAQILSLYEEGLGRLFEAGAVEAVIGHSQGILPALLVAEGEAGRIDLERAEVTLALLVWQGLLMRRSFGAGADRAAGEGAWTPMVAVTGPNRATLARAVVDVNRALPPEARVEISLHNTRTRHVVSGPRDGLVALMAWLDGQAGREAKARSAGRLGGQPLRVGYDPVPTDTAFHSSWMAEGLENIRLAAREVGWQVDASRLSVDVLAPADGALVNASADPTDLVLTGMHTSSVDWPATLDRALAGRTAEVVLDLGPGDGVAKLTRSVLKGRGVRVLALTTPEGRAALLTPGQQAEPTVRYADFAPAVIELAHAPGLRVDNAFTRFTGRSPMILPGMTPTTSEVELVAAAANAGYVAELAGGGQVSERIFWLRMEELAQKLEPGQEVVFNALYLDPYLWDLHLRKQRLVFEARRRGYPICGVTISAGVPPVAEAVALLDELAAAGIWLNAFKPGTIGQVKQVIEIARAARNHTICVHLEGGKAGGHHSWEELDELLLEATFAVRSEPNLLLCVGGGVGTEERAVELLTGRWARRHGEPDMPVDALLLGTVTMACAEAATSPQVKEALVAAAGTPSWVFAGGVAGGVTSGKSQLNADIHYLDNAASRCGRLLDEVAGREDAVIARRDAIIEALNATARPYFGDLEAMSYRQVLDRMVELMAIGRHGRYEDGRWLDPTWRQRFVDVLRRAEARLSEVDEGEVESLVTTPADVDEPEVVLAAFAGRYGERQDELVEPADALWFVRQVCARPGKPVPFVPVIDADVRRWYKADSLWQAHDARFVADRVLVIPGPEAVAGICRVDEPVASLLGRFEGAVVEALRDVQVIHRATDRRSVRVPSAVPTGVHVEVEATRTTIVARTPDHDEVWFGFVASQMDGPASELFRARTVFVDGRAALNPVRRLCAAVSGARVVIENDASGAVVAVRWQSRAGGLDEQVLIEDEGGVFAVRTTSPVAAPLVLRIAPRHQAGAWSLHMDAGERAHGLMALYHRTMFGGDLASVGLFEAASATVRVDGEQLVAWRASTGGGVGRGVASIPLSAAFSLVWEPLFAVLSADALAGGILDLVHLSNVVEQGPAWPPVPGESLEVEARLVELEGREQGQVVRTTAWIRRGQALVAEVRSGFFLRGVRTVGPWRRERRERVERRLLLEGQAEVDFLLGHGWISVEVPARRLVGAELDLRVEWLEAVAADGEGHFGAWGELLLGGAVVGRVDLDERARHRIHPVAAVLEGLGLEAGGGRPVERRTLLAERGATPRDMGGFAAASGDLNPIHRSPLLARLAGLPGPIVHGMWMAGRLQAAVESCAPTARLRRVEVDFLDMALPSESVELDVVRAGITEGGEVVEATLRALREQGPVAVCRLRASMTPVRTAYVFPGQGIQQKGMGMDGYGRSRAARRIWDRADAFTRAHLGFSILRIVRENPRELVVNGVPHVHPRGVLNLTQFTQVAMAVLAQAQLAELREQGLFVEESVTAGHSVGEYNALAAVLQVFPLESQVELVYQRGCTMHTMVPRDASGESGYRMGVVRPHYAGLDHAGAEALVAQVAAETGEFVQIVNYNVDGRQYSVTGTIAGLARLQAELARRTRPGAKPAWIEVPGIDVPFHSRVLVVGVPAFRTWLDTLMPAHIDHRLLVGRYVPNLVARLFELTPAFVASILEVAEAEPLRAVLDDFETWAAEPDRLARLLLVELLAWQFASPVRWIETQRVLLAPVERGGVAKVVEVGVGYQPTLANMARATVGMLPAAAAVSILNVEAERDQVYMLDRDAAVASPAAAPEAVEAVAPVAAPVVAVASGTGVRPADRPFGVLDGLTALLALQARVRPEQISPRETIDELFDGVSSRRNQVLMDLGAEFGVGTIDGAHERPIAELAKELGARASSYAVPGRYLVPARDEAVRTALGRSGVKVGDLEGLLDQTYGLGAGLRHAAMVTLALETRTGESVRGGVLGRVGGETPKDRASAEALVGRVVEALGERIGQRLAPLSSGAASGAAVDAAVVRELEERILGRGGVLGRMADALDAALGRELTVPAAEASEATEAPGLSSALGEYGREHLEMIEPRFDAVRHVAFTSAWAWAERDVATLYYDAVNGRRDVRSTLNEARRLAAFAAEPRVQLAATWFAALARRNGHLALADVLGLLTDARNASPAAVQVSRPSLTVGGNGRLHYEEVPVTGADTLTSFVDEMLPREGDGPVAAGAFDAAWRECLLTMTRRPAAFAGRTALVTGASPGSIAIEIVRHLLRGGARVVVTTTNTSAARIAFYRSFYQEVAGPGAELHVVPFNQASVRDVDALVAWIFGELTEQAGATVRVLKRPWAPDLIVPFGAIGDSGTLDQLEGRSEAALRGMLVGVERLIARIGARYVHDGVPAGRCHVLLPLSPNHGVFGGDGFYAESKAALEVLMHRWHSERHAWGAPMTLCAATIGWVRGTGLMDQNNPVAGELERRTGVRTFSSAEMGFLLASLCAEAARAASRTSPLRVDLSGGFLQIADLDTVVAEIRHEIAASAADAARLDALRTAEARALGVAGADVVTMPALPGPHRPSVPTSDEVARATAAGNADLASTVVIVATGEIGPCGSGRTRNALEVDDELSAAAVVELAWMTGLIRYEAAQARWVDVESGQEVAEAELAGRYREVVRSRVGLRWFEPATAGFDPEHLPVMATVFLERDFTFPVASAEEGRAFVRATPEDAELRFDAAADQWLVVRKAGSTVRVPRTTRLRRHVAGLVPTGFDFGRYGIGPDLVESVDRTTLFNLVATVDAWVSAGLSPEELLARLHPARVANTQGSGIGGMRSIHRLYTDHLLERPEQSDVLQETLINVIAAYVVQAYVGSYGAMSHPVGACATAAVSLEEGMDKILVGKADFVVAGGYDDLGPEGMAGFEGMSATCDTDQMAAMGFEPHQMSRPNDARRRGFVEAQGGGTVLLARGDLALELGLPVVAVLGWAGSFGDGIHKSIPAPGLGVLAAGCGGERSPLGQALSRYGMSADDIGVVYKHDTSTNANDPNENELHHQLQRALGRSAGNPLWVVSQKALTGHSKGGSAAWQLAGLCETLQRGVVAGNRNLESVDEAMRPFTHMGFTDRALQPGPASPVRAGLLTSLGFGHVSAIALVLHRDAFLGLIPAERRQAWLDASRERVERGQRSWARVRLGLEPAFVKRQDRRFGAADGTELQRQREIQMLLDPDARLDPTTGAFVASAR